MSGADDDVTGQSHDETTWSPAGDDVIVVTSPVYVPMTREEPDAETQLESDDTFQGQPVPGQGRTSTNEETATSTATTTSSKQHDVIVVMTTAS